MKKILWLTEKDMLSYDHFPIIAIFNLIPNKLFIETISSLCQGIGFGVDYGNCFFYNDLDGYDKMFTEAYDGVRFKLHDGEEVIIDNDTFYYYLQKVCMNYLEDYSENSKQVFEILQKVKQQLKL